MAHPYQKFRQANVERARVGAITKGLKVGGSVTSRSASSKVKSRAAGADEPEGGLAAARMDRPRRANGGSVKKPTTVVNVITSGQQQPPAAPPMPAMPPPPPPMPPGPPPGAMAPMPGPGPGMGAPPPPGMPMRARGGGVKSVGMKVGTKVQHDVAKPSDTPAKLHRPRVVTFKTGGGVVSFKARGGGINAPAKGGMGPKMHAGAGSAEGRLEKI
jgi:hypothetical protein